MLNGILLGAVNQSSLMLLVLVAVMFIPMIFTSKNQKKQAQQRNDMLDSLKKGDEILTIGGFYGVVRSRKDDRFVIELLPDKVKVEIRKDAVANKVVQEAAEEAAEELEYDVVLDDTDETPTEE